MSDALLPKWGLFKDSTGPSPEKPQTWRLAPWSCRHTSCSPEGGTFPEAGMGGPRDNHECCKLTSIPGGWLTQSPELTRPESQLQADDQGACSADSHWYAHVCSVVSSSLHPHRPWPARLISPWNFQAGILEWVVISSSSGSSWPRDLIFVSSHWGCPQLQLPVSKGACYVEEARMRTWE